MSIASSIGVSIAGALSIIVSQISITTLLLPSRTGRIGAWLLLFIIVFSILLPMVVGYQHALVTWYRNTLIMWEATLKHIG
jgi:hypothetical protein